MQKRIALVWTIILIMLLGTPASGALAQAANTSGSSSSGPLRFERFTVEDGLPNATVLYSVQDNDGFIWFATPDGLARYDGQNFRVFRADKEDEDSLSSSNIFSLAIDKDGVLWVGTDGGGLNRYDATTETFQDFQFREQDDSSLTNNAIWSLFVDSNNQLWVGTRGGLNRFNRDTETFTAYINDPEDPRTIANDVVLSFEETHDGILWIGTRTGLSRYDAETDDFTNYVNDPENPSSISDNQVWDMLEDSKGDFWIATRYGGLNHFDRQSDAFTAYQHDESDPLSISDNNIFHLYEDSQSNFWIATEKGGLNLFNRETGTFSSYQHDPNDVLTISNNDLFWIMEDTSGSLWITSRRNGVNQLVPELQRFDYYRYSVNQPMSLSTDNVYSLWAPGDCIYWVGTDGGGLTRIDAVRQKSTFYQNDPNNPNSLPNDTIYAIYGEEETGVLWIGTVGGGLSRFDTKRYKFTNYQRNPEDVTALASNFLTAIAPAGNNRLWIGTLGFGLELFDTETGQVVEHITNEPDNPNSLSENTVFALLPDADGTLWIGTARGGISHYDPKTAKFTTYKNVDNDPESLIDNGVQALAIDLEGNIWAGTANGLSRLDPDTGKFMNFTSKDGLPGNSVFGVLVDEFTNDLWVSTSRGIGQYQQESQQWRTFDVHDGLQGTQFNLFAYAKSPDGEFIFGGPNGINAFTPSKIALNTFTPEVIFTGIHIWGQPVAIGSEQLPQALNDTEKITLQPDDEMVTIQFSATNYQIRQHNQYQTKLEGFTTEWSPPSSKTEVTFTNLNPGTYTFLVRTANNDHVWNETPRSLTLVVLPEWYETTLFRIGAVLSVAVAILIFMRQRVHTLQYQKQSLILNVNERTKELRAEVDRRQSVEEELRKSNTLLQERIEEVSGLHMQLQAQAIRDDLTGLFNRRYLSENLPRELARAERKGYELTFMILDLDRFKQINDTFGHAIGDQVLISFSNALLNLTREMDAVCRYGGEEFVILAPEMSANEAMRRAEDIRSSIESMPIFIPGQPTPITMTVSIGIACYPSQTADIDDLINAADTALYEAKNSGRNQIRIYQKTSEG